MKKIILWAISLFLISSIVSCNNAWTEVTITDIDKYDTIWFLQERSASETSILFPAVANEDCTTAFLLKHTVSLPLGTRWQVLLEIKYSEQNFLSEVKRLTDLCAASPICGVSEHFDIPAYATVWNWHGCFEYALVNHEERTISYLYIKSILYEDDFIIDRKYIFKDYDWDLPDSEIYNIYS